ncbi:MAG: hypothetical protein ACLUHC_05150 [Clostridia bacterium]
MELRRNKKKEGLYRGKKLHEIPGYLCISCRHNCEKYDDICKGYQKKRKR